MDVRRLAALDMYGSRGAPRRARVILVEFAVGAVAITLFGLWLATRADGWSSWLMAAWILGIGANYVPLLAHALSLRDTARLGAELADVDTGRELRRYGIGQLWILVPFALVLFAVIPPRAG